MKTTAIALCAAALVAAVQAYSLLLDDLEPHSLHKREVNCSYVHRHESPRLFHKCCKKLIDIVGGPPDHFRPPHRHGSHNHGPNESSEESGSSSSEEGHSHGGEHGSHSEHHGGEHGSHSEHHGGEHGSHSEHHGGEHGSHHEHHGPPPPGHHGPPPPGHHGPPPPGHHGPPPPPGGGPILPCIIQEGYENKSLISDGKIDPAAIKTYLQGALEEANATSYSTEAINEIVDKCTPIAEEWLSHNNATDCHSGAFEFQICFHRKMFLICPAEYWKNTDKCNSVKEFVGACPPPAWSPPPPPTGAV